MMMSQVAEALVEENLDAILHGADVLMTGVSKDTRDIHKGDLYIALVGERFDGHRFIHDAKNSGAVGALVSDYNEVENLAGLPQVQVKDTKVALGKLATNWRSSWAKQSIANKLIGITGSNGKTSVKEMCHKILTDFSNAESVLSTKGNLNNDIGMPMMLLELREQHQYAVIEMGANHAAEIDYLTHLAKPDVAIVNNVGPAHLEGFGSLENISKAKAEIYNGLSEDGFAVINKDDVFSPFWFDYCENQCAAKNIVSFSMQDPGADVYAVLVSEDCYQVTVSGEQAELRLKVPGNHNVMNALAAIAVTYCVGIPLSSAVSSLSDFKNIKGRLTVTDSALGYRVIDDSYNANPRSVSAAIDVLAAMAKSEAKTDGFEKTVLVLGDMAELGDDAITLHQEIGEKAKNKGINAFYATGDYCQNAVAAFGENGFWFQNKDSLSEALQNDLTGNEIVLIKGSRSAAMEKVVDQILTHANNNKRVG